MFDIHEATLQFYAMVETAFEMAGPGKDPLIGDIFEEMAEVGLVLRKNAINPFLYNVEEWANILSKSCSMNMFGHIYYYAWKGQDYHETCLPAKYAVINQTSGYCAYKCSLYFSTTWQDF